MPSIVKPSRLIGKRIKRLNLRLDKAHKQREINCSQLEDPFPPWQEIQ